LPEGVRDEAARNVVEIVARNDLEQARQIAERLPAGQGRERALSIVAINLAGRDPSAAADFARNLSEGAAAEAWPNIARVWVHRGEPSATAQWVAQLPEGSARSGAARNVIDQWAKTDPAAAAQWLERLPAGPTRDVAAATFATEVRGTDPASAMEWAATVSNLNQREAAVRQVLDTWRKKDPARRQSVVGKHKCDWRRFALRPAAHALAGYQAAPNFMKDNTKISVLFFSVLAFSVVASGSANEDNGQAAARASDDPAHSSTPYPGCVKIFNGQNFEGWEGGPVDLEHCRRSHARRWWHLASRLHEGGLRQLSSDLHRTHEPGKPGSPRCPCSGAIVPRILPDQRSITPAGSSSCRHTEPCGIITPPKHHNLPHETIAKGSKDFTEWHTTELLCNLEEGTVRAAVDGIEIARYTHADPAERKDPEKRIVAGPIGMFRHGGGASEYKAIYVETNPKEDRLLTVR
jgi:hypothetical protein